MRNLTVNGERLWASLMELARIGATEKGGVCRLAASDLDAEARRLFIRWCEEAGCAVTIDGIGNIFARRPGRNPALAPIEIVAWTNEEGSRFSPAMVGSGAFTGVFTLDEALATRDNTAPDLTLGA